MDARLQAAARATPGFLLEEEGLALHAAGLRAGRLGPLLEIGAYCGKSAVYLAAAARVTRTLLFSVDHHRGSEEQQPGQEYFDSRLVGPDGRVDSLPVFRSAISSAGLEDVAVAVVAQSAALAAVWRTALGLVFIDGSHSEAAVLADFEGWSPRLLAGGLLVFHDVFEDPADGGQAPFHVMQRALASGQFHQLSAAASLRVLEKA